MKITNNEAEDDDDDDGFDDFGDFTVTTNQDQ